MRWTMLALAAAVAMAGHAQGQTSRSTEPAKSEVDALKIGGKTFEQWLKELSARDPSKRESAIRAVCSFPPETAVKAIPTLLVELRRHNSSTPVDLSVRCNLCTALGELFAMGQKVEPKHKAEAIALLRFHLRDTQAILRYRAATALGAMGSDARAAVPDLLFTIRDGMTWEVRQAGASALGAIAGDENTGPPLAVLKALYDLLGDPAFQVRLAAVQSLSFLGPPADQDLIDNFVNALLPVALKDPEPGLQIWARIAIIGATKDFSATNITPIVKHVSHAEPGVRVQAIQALGAIGPQAKAGVGSIINGLSDSDPNVQVAAIWALSRMETAAAPALPILERIANDPNQSDFLKNAAKDSLKKIRGR